MKEKEQEKASPFRPVAVSTEKSKTKSYEEQVFEVVTEASQIQGIDDESSKRKIELYNVAYHLVEKSQWSDEKAKVQSIVNILKENGKSGFNLVVIAPIKLPTEAPNINIRKYKTK